MFNLFRNRNQSSEFQHLEIELSDLAELNEAIKLSRRKKVYLFKHSTRCGVSAIVFKKFKDRMQGAGEQFFYINVLKNRPVSNAVADRFALRHESPQLLILKDGEVLGHGSHYGLLDELEI